MNLIAITPRATRYNMAARVVYRGEGQAAWQEGQVINVSRTGVLFEPKGAEVPLSAAIEFVIDLPGAGHRGHPRVQCHGHVVRSAGTATATAVAATIDAYEFLCPGITSAQEGSGL